MKAKEPKKGHNGKVEEKVEEKIDEDPDIHPILGTREERLELLNMNKQRYIDGYLKFSKFKDIPQHEIDAFHEECVRDVKNGLFTPQTGTPGYDEWIKISPNYDPEYEEKRKKTVYKDGSPDYIFWSSGTDPKVAATLPEVKIRPRGYIPSYMQHYKSSDKDPEEDEKIN